jgi:hypothetical protein
VLWQEKYEKELKDTRVRELMRIEEVAILDKVGAYIAFLCFYSALCLRVSSLWSHSLDAKLVALLVKFMKISISG